MKDQPLYKALSDEIRSAILDGRLSPGDKLPSKRAMAAEKKLSIITVAGAYDLLVDEGFIESTERRGYFVSKSASRPKETGKTRTPPEIRLPLRLSSRRRLPLLHLGKARPRNHL